MQFTASTCVVAESHPRPSSVFKCTTHRPIASKSTHISVRPWLKVIWRECLAHSQTCSGSLRTTISAAPLPSVLSVGSPIPSDQTVNSGYRASKPSRRVLEVVGTREGQDARCARALLCCRYRFEQKGQLYQLWRMRRKI